MIISVVPLTVCPANEGHLLRAGYRGPAVDVGVGGVGPVPHCSATLGCLHWLVLARLIAAPVGVSAAHRCHCGVCPDEVGEVGHCTQPDPVAHMPRVGGDQDALQAGTTQW